MCFAPSPCRKLWVFDFDDTLAKTGSRVFIVGADGSKIPLEPHEYVARLHGSEERPTFDYSEFLRLIDPRPVQHNVDLLHQARRACGPERVYVLSARSIPDPIEEFLCLVGAADVEAVAAADARPAAKEAWIRQRLDRGDVDELEFFDDFPGNVEAVRALAQEYPRVAFAVHLVER